MLWASQFSRHRNQVYCQLSIHGKDSSRGLRTITHFPNPNSLAVPSIPPENLHAKGQLAAGAEGRAAAQQLRASDAASGVLPRSRHLESPRLAFNANPLAPFLSDLRLTLGDPIGVHVLPNRTSRALLTSLMKGMKLSVKPRGVGVRVRGLRGGVTTPAHARDVPRGTRWS